MAAHRVQALLMGGQACVFYGAAEFSRDTDLLVLADAGNLQRLDAALRELQAECIAVPPFAAEYLERGHAIHFRCHHPEAADMRVDVMSKLRGVDPFPAVWERRTSIADADGTTYELLALPDLVLAKKTQRGKDWPMLQRLLEAHYLQHRAAPTPEQRRFWLLELRTPEMLAEAVRANAELARDLSNQRPLLGLAASGVSRELSEALTAEENAERERDRLHWQPLKAELERLRHSTRQQ
jgi:hypothetical protein